MAINTHALRIHFRKGLCADSMSKIEFNVVGNSC